LAIEIAVGLLGGLALFVYGMKQMSEGLQKTAGKRLRHLLASLTTRPTMGILVGTGVTAIIQSSSATTVMVVGFVNAGLMTLAQSIGVIMGANIGTTVTAQLISFDLGDYAFHAIFLGVALYLFARNRKHSYIGQTILGFGILFLGLNIMSETMMPLRDSPVFMELMASLSTYPILGLLAGVIVTFAVQSSTASFGILLGLASAGVIDYQAAIPIILGENIGTTFTAALSSLGANLTSKRAATAHFMFNVFGSTLVLLLIYLVPGFMPRLENLMVGLFRIFDTPRTMERMLANTHTAFNIVNTLIWLPFIGLLEKTVTRFIPGEDMTIKRGLSYIDERMKSTPSVALEQVKEEVLRMQEITRDMIEDAFRSLLEADPELADEVIKREEIINEIQEDLLHFLTSLESSTLSDEDARDRDYFIAVADLVESMADDADDMADLAHYIRENDVCFSAQALESLEEVAREILELVDKSIMLVEEENYDLVPDLINGERDMDSRQLEFRNEHMTRLKKGICEPTAGIIYLEAIEDIEHLTDQMADIAHSLMEK